MSDQMSRLRESVGKAIYDEAIYHSGQTPMWDRQDETAKNYWRAKADAAIQEGLRGEALHA